MRGASDKSLVIVIVAYLSIFIKEYLCWSLVFAKRLEMVSSSSRDSLIVSIFNCLFIDQKLDSTVLFSCTLYC